MELHNLTRDSTYSYLRAANKNGGWVMITIILRVVRMKKNRPSIQIVQLTKHFRFSVFYADLIGTSCIY